MLSLFDKAKQADILAIVQKAGINAKRSGRRYFIQCPHHEDKTPSCVINIDGKHANTYHCFSCNNGGSVVDLYSALHGVETMEAAKILANDAIIQLEPAKRPDIEPDKPININAPILGRFVDWCKGYKATNQKRAVFKYLVNRGLSIEAIKAGNIVAIPSNEAAINWLQLPENKNLAIDAGLLLSSDKGGYYFPFYYYPLIFPAIAQNGDIITIQGRRIDEKDKMEGGPAKYKYLTGKKYPFGIHSLDRSGPVVLVEGPLDCAVLLASEKGPVIGLGGLSVPSLLPPMIRGRKVALCLDNDEAGKAGIERLASQLKEAGINQVFKASLIDATSKDVTEANRKTKASKQFMQLEAMMEKNKSLKMLVDTFKLRLE